MTDPQPLSALRLSRWATVPKSPGVYWWFFPASALDQMRIVEVAVPARLPLRRSADGKVCLYHGLANNLAQRIEWHAAQKLTLKCLQTGFLSTFRFTLLALNDYDYLEGSQRIDDFFDDLSVSWQVASTREEAENLERAELCGDFCFPLNIQSNKRAELAAMVRHLKSVRRAYKHRYLLSGTCITPSQNQP